MATGTLEIVIFDGRRAEMPGPVEFLVTVLDGRQKTVLSAFFDKSRIVVKDLEVRNSLQDRYTVVASAKGRCDAGVSPVVVRAGEVTTVELMMLPRDPVPAFEPFSVLQTTPRHAALTAFLSAGVNLREAEARYGGLFGNPAAHPRLACLLNVAEALGQMRLVGAAETAQHPEFAPNPLGAIKGLASEPEQDRIFVWADDRLPAQVQETIDRQGTDVSRFTKALSTLHKGATSGHKQTEFGEGNVQFSYHEDDRKMTGGVPCIKVDIDIDYFRDPGSHLILEVFPNALKKAVHGTRSRESMTDPYKVYGLRWMASRQRRLAFEPAYAL